MGMEGVKTGAFWLRFFEMICAIVAFSTVVDYDSSSRIKFVMFTGITAFILALFFMVAYMAGVGAARGIFSLVVDVLWTIFWLVAAGCVSSFLADVPDTSKLQASTAFSWISWFLWIGSTIISFQDWRGGVSGPAPTGPPGIPNSSVSMV
ncbi:MARVEL-like domain [Micractinium conductrix]|uniref:MARVEL-like domain n=1 Tax=Micractinium conductrix TaxID=554055 RepID=A0A2P6V9Z7_9CHLO|nr:MARVEL-like domain [Micractinium conductrix]|eukprot:PSC70881.1 MARVEL-like domain [Micractinium conductrix]